LHIDFVPNHQKWEGIRVHGVRLCHEDLLPVHKGLESILLRNIIHKTAAISASIKGTRQGLEAFLACRVPDLEYHDSIIELDFLVGKVCTDRGLKVVGEPGMFELLDQRGLTHS